MIRMEKIYEAVVVDEEFVVDEELGMNAGKEEAEATRITPPSTDINRPVIVILYWTVILLSISLNVSQFNTSERVRFVLFRRSTLQHHYSSHHRKSNYNFSDDTKYLIVSGAVDAAIFGLVFMKLYTSFGAFYLYILGWTWLNYSHGSVAMPVDTYLNVIASCSFLVVYFLAMDGQFSKTKRYERYEIEAIIVIVLLLVINI
jgi:hypothetical protein